VVASNNARAGAVVRQLANQPNSTDASKTKALALLTALTNQLCHVELPSGGWGLAA
jgi:hypothetical protein